MEVVARDLKALGLYQARALSYDGVEVELLEHPLTPEQRRIYDAYADAFKIIHAHLEQALQSTGISDEERTLNRNAKSAAMSAFEGAKQRFFGHLLTSMKCPSLTSTGPSSASRRAPRRNLGHLPRGLERIEHVIEPDSTQCPCGCGQMIRIGEDRTERLDIVPAQLRVIVTVRPKYACRSARREHPRACAAQLGRGSSTILAKFFTL